jgi:hypothetical protein
VNVLDGATGSLLAVLCGTGHLAISSAEISSEIMVVPPGPLGSGGTLACFESAREVDANLDAVRIAHCGARGFPNATVVSAPFGIYVLDTIQAIQLVLLSNCSDETQTQHAVQRFVAWLQQAEQSDALVRFARKRKEIVKLLAQTI